MFKLTFLFLLCVSFVFAKPIVNTKYKYYDIYPSGTLDMDDILNEEEPLNAYETTRHGKVNWRLSYTYTRFERENYCKVGKVKTFLTITYFLPKIEKKHTISNKTKESFRKYSKHLRKYLNNYNTIALNAAKTLERELVILPKEVNCEKLSKIAKSKAKKIIAKYKKEHKNYAIRTFDGFIEGKEIKKL